MGNCYNTTKTSVSELQKDANVEISGVNDNLFQKEIRKGSMTGFFQATRKKIPEEIQNNTENYIEGGFSNTVTSHKFVKENNGLEMTDVQ